MRPCVGCGLIINPGGSIGLNVSDVAHQCPAEGSPMFCANGTLGVQPDLRAVAPNVFESSVNAGAVLTAAGQSWSTPPANWLNIPVSSYPQICGALTGWHAVDFTSTVILRSANFGECIPSDCAVAATNPRAIAAVDMTYEGSSDGGLTWVPLFLGGTSTSSFLGSNFHELITLSEIDDLIDGSGSGSFTFRMTFTAAGNHTTGSQIIISNTTMLGRARRYIGAVCTETVSTTITPPTAVGNTISATAGTEITAVDLKANDTYTGDAEISIVNGEVPEGIDISPDGIVTGAPTTPGFYLFTYRITTSRGSATADVSIRVEPKPAAPVPTAGNDSISVTTGQAFSLDLTVNDTPGVGPSTWSIVSGAPPGVSISPQGRLNGLVSSPGSFTITYRIVDANNATATATVTLAVSASTAVPSAVGEDAAVIIGKPFSYNIAFNDSPGVGPSTWTILSGAPSGVTMTTNGNLQGTVSSFPSTGADRYQITYRITDANGATSDATIRLFVNAALSTPVAVSDATTVTIGAPFTFNAAVNDTIGTPPSTWEITSISPAAPGVTMSTAGMLTGTINVAGTYNIGYRITDANGQTASALVVLTATTATGPSLVDDIGYDGFTVGNSTALFWPAWNDSLGVEPVTYSSSGLPAGLSMDPTDGIIRGTPTTAGTFSYTYTVTDANGASDTANGTLIIGGTTPPSSGAFFYGGQGVFRKTIAEMGSGLVLHPRSATMVNAIVNSGNGRGVTTEAYATSVLDVDPAGDTYRVIIRNDSDNFPTYGNFIPLGFNNATFLYPTIKVRTSDLLDGYGNVNRPSGTDHHIVIRDLPNDRALHLWIGEIDVANKVLYGGWGGVFPRNSDGNSLAPNYSPPNDSSYGPYAVDGSTINRATGAGSVYGATAAGTSSYQGAITFEDLQRGYIDHALIFASEFAAGRRTDNPANDYFVYPATTHDGQDFTAARIECGVRFQLQMSDAAIAAISHPGQRMVARAAKDYGLFMIDYAGAGMTIVAQRPRPGVSAETDLFTSRAWRVGNAAGTDDGWNPANEIDWSTMRALVPAGSNISSF